MLLFVSYYRPPSHVYVVRYDRIPFPAGDKLWWADQGTDQIGTCDKKDGGNWKVLRNNTSPMHMSIYDEDVQKGKKMIFLAKNKYKKDSAVSWKDDSHDFGCHFSVLETIKPEMSLFGFSLIFAFAFSWYQPVQQQQRRLFPAVSAHVSDHQGLHVHSWIQPEVRAAVLRR